MPVNLTLTPNGAGKLLAQCDVNPGATAYHWFRKIQGTDTDYVELPATDVPQEQLANLPTGATVAVHVIASNAGGDSPQTDDVTAVADNDWLSLISLSQRTNSVCLSFERYASPEPSAPRSVARPEICRNSLSRRLTRRPPLIICAP